MIAIAEKIADLYKDESKRCEIAQFLYAFSISFGWYIDDGYRRIALLFALLLMWKSHRRSNFVHMDNILFKIQKNALIILAIWFTFIPLFFGAAQINERISDIARPIEVILYSIVGWHWAKEQSFMRWLYKLSCISALFFFMAVFCYRFYMSFSTAREHWFFDMRAEFAGIILLSLMPWLYCFIFEKKKIPVRISLLYFFILLLAVVSITVTYYRNIWVAWIGQFFITFILLPKVFNMRWRDSLARAVVILSICICLVGIAYQNSYEIRDNVNSFIQFYKDSDFESFSSKRLEIWLEAASLIKERPFTGYGWCDYNEFATIKKFNPHSSYLQAAFIGGVPGVLLYSFVLILLWWQGIGNIFYKHGSMRFSLAVTLMLTATIIAGLTESYVYVGREYLIPFWSILAIFLSSSYQEKLDGKRI